MTGKPDVSAGQAATPDAGTALDDRIAALVDAAPPPSEAMLDRIADLLAPDGAHA